MSANPIYDEIVDTIVQHLEVDTNIHLPTSFTVNLPPEQMEALLKAGLVQGGEALPLTVTTLTIAVARYRVTLAVDKESDS